jgi:CRISPR system Cascade subunit CasE
MYLSQLLVNMGDDPDKPRPGMAWIKHTYRVHQRIWMAFPDDAQLQADPLFLGEWSTGVQAKPRRSDAGFLFRIEPDRPTRILVQSVQKPNWAYAFQNAPHLLAEPPMVREFQPHFQAGNRFRFRLAMLMVKRRSKKHRQSDPKIPLEVPIRCVVDGKPDFTFTAWTDRLGEAAVQHGFRVDELRVQPNRSLRMKDRPTNFNAALFDGLLECTDPERLKAAVINGIGRGKAFGMGLLSLAVLK